MNPKKPINTVANTIEEYPNNRFLENIGIISEKIPKAGRLKYILLDDQISKINVPK